jgi:hypothetical protein
VTSLSSLPTVGPYADAGTAGLANSATRRTVNRTCDPSLSSTTTGDPTATSRSRKNTAGPVRPST